MAIKSLSLLDVIARSEETERRGNLNSKEMLLKSLLSSFSKRGGGWTALAVEE